MLDKLVYGARLLGIQLSEEQLRLFQVYFEELTAWNRKVNLTAITDYEEVQTRHFLDSITLLPIIRDAFPGKPCLRVLDVGTGAGLPGLPLRIVGEGLDVTLVDSVAKKTAFVKHLIGKLGLGMVQVVTERAEELAHREEHRERSDVVVTRALSNLSTVAELCLPFCRTGGIVLAQKKNDIQNELSRARGAVKVLGGAVREVRPVEHELLEPRCVVVFEKVAATPVQYPRRPGIPAKRPL